MSYDKCEIKHARDGEYYEMKIDGQFYGNYDSVADAAKDFDRLKMEEEGSEWET